MTPTLFQKLLGAPFYSLPDAVRALHEIRGHCVYVGRVDVERGRNLLARLCARLAGLPPARQGAAISIAFDTLPNCETWRRNFDGHAMQSTLVKDGRYLSERLGPVRFRLALRVLDGAIVWHVERARLFNVIPLPMSWFVDVRCREGEDNGRYTFEVQASMPLVGLLVRYAGWLEHVEVLHGSRHDGQASVARPVDDAGSTPRHATA